ncbi:MAG: protoheme IX farnesyltransferase [Verrucomicrobia bacterium]|nr:protoheme IX farnesyltransferase [Cytophagales bacterium]
MINASSEITIWESSIVKAKAFLELMKIRLAALVAFSGAFGYLLALREPMHWFNWDGLHFVLFNLAAILITGAANTVNQIKEIGSDKLMKRTQNRPLPTGRLSATEATIFASVLLLISVFIFAYFFNIRAAGLAVLSFLLYGFVYTPLKKVGPIAVFIGAFPGAFPPMIGWVAATNHFGLEPGILFAIQFFWQFPHFWAIAWVANEDYRKAGFKLLPAKGEKDLSTAIQIMIWTLFLLPLSWVPFQLKMTGMNSGFIAMICGVLFLAQTFNLIGKQTDKAARMMMFGSFLYLPIVQIAFLLDKI